MMNTQCSKHVEEYNKLIIKQEFAQVYLYTGRMSTGVMIPDAV